MARINNLAREAGEGNKNIQGRVAESENHFAVAVAERSISTSQIGDGAATGGAGLDREQNGTTTLSLDNAPTEASTTNIRAIKSDSNQM
jgi:hypothetical protein